MLLRFKNQLDIFDVTFCYLIIATIHSGATDENYIQHFHLRVEDLLLIAFSLFNIELLAGMIHTGHSKF